MSETIKSSMFSPHENTPFSLTVSPEETIETTLIEITILGPVPEPAKWGAMKNLAQREPFSLIFRGPLGKQLAQGTYNVQHPTMGNMELFMVPVGIDDEGVYYETIFN